MDRRKFIVGASALFCAPAIIRAENVMKIQMPRSKLIVQEQLGFCSYYGLPFYHATELTYFGSEIDQIVRFDDNEALIMPDPLPSSLREISPFKGDIILDIAAYD